MASKRYTHILLRLATVYLILVVGLGTTAICSHPVQGSAAAAPHAQSLSDPLVLALYYPWYDESTWTYDRLSDLPAEPYASRDRAVMGRQIDQAKAAGIDAFLVAWYGPGDGNQTETNLTALLDEAAARNFRVAVLFETNSPFFGGPGDVVAALQHLNATHAPQPAYLRAAGRPVVFFWRPSVYGVDTWRDMRNQADPGYANVWISEGVDTSFLQVFDGHFLYSNTWNPAVSLDATNGKFAGLVATASQQMGTPKLWIATVMPGYDDTRIRSGGFAYDRAGGGYYAESWQSAIDSGPAWIVINSFNEWVEGSQIEPSVAFGNQYLDLTATWSNAFKGQSNPRVQAASVAAAPPSPAPLPHVEHPTAFVDVALLNLRAGPSTDYEILGQVVQGTPLPISGIDVDYPDWYQVSIDAGGTGAKQAWVYASLVQALGPLDQAISVQAPPAPPTVATADTSSTDTPATVPSAVYGQASISPDPSRRSLIPHRSH